MILGFKKVFPWGEPTYFEEKILLSVTNSPGRPCHLVIKDTGLDENLYPKIHTIRAGNRWKIGMRIEMAHGVRTKNYHQFNTGIDNLSRVVSVQRIKISCTGANDPETYWPKISVDGLVIGYVEKFKGKDASGEAHMISTDPSQVTSFVRNDGFNSITQFCRWFKEDFEGQIIHWTDFRYE